MGNKMKDFTGSRGAQQQEGEVSGRVQMRRRDVPVLFGRGGHRLDMDGVRQEAYGEAVCATPGGRRDPDLRGRYRNRGGLFSGRRRWTRRWPRPRSGKSSAGARPESSTENALKRLPEVLQEVDPDLMVLGYGAMDLWKATDRAQPRRTSAP